MRIRTIIVGLIAVFVPCTPSALAQSTTFSYTGASQMFTVPPGVTQITVAACGAQGGGVSEGSAGGRGGCTTAPIVVTPGEMLQVNVGGHGGSPSSAAGGSGGWNGGASGGGSSGLFGLASGAGGGGGASDLSRAGTRLVIGGGGGGGGVDGADANFAGAGGSGGGESGGPGGTVRGGGGGTQTSGGTSGGTGANSGTLGNGGAGGSYSLGGGGGGGGYYGGGGGAGTLCSSDLCTGVLGSGGGGGGSGFGPAGVQFQSGARSGHGQVVITLGDTEPPETTITGGPTGPTNDNTPTFTFTSDEEGSSFACRFAAAAAFASCSSPYTIGPLVPGPYTFEVQATDAAGNPDPTPASVSFTVEATVPTPPPTGTGGPALPPGCDVAGTEGNDVITGTAAGERICGLGGNDVIKGLGGNDVLIGGKGNDRLVGGGGKDRFLGGAGRDFLAMRDRAKEFGDGGKGIDTAATNRGDTLRRVEKRR